MKSRTEGHWPGVGSAEIACCSEKSLTAGTRQPQFKLQFCHLWARHSTALNYSWLHSKRENMNYLVEVSEWNKGTQVESPLQDLVPSGWLTDRRNFHHQTASNLPKCCLGIQDSAVQRPQGLEKNLNWFGKTWPARGRPSRSTVAKRNCHNSTNVEVFL